MGHLWNTKIGLSNPDLLPDTLEVMSSTVLNPICNHVKYQIFQDLDQWLEQKCPKHNWRTILNLNYNKNVSTIPYPEVYPETAVDGI